MKCIGRCLSLVAISFVLLAALPAAQTGAPLLATVVSPAPLSGYFRISLINNSNVTAADAMVQVQTEIAGRGGRCGPRAQAAADGGCAWTLDHRIALAPLVEIPPGASRSVRVMSQSPPSARVIGVIYADGSSAGSPAVIHAMLLERAADAAELQAVRSLLQNALASPGGPNIAQLIDALNQLEQSHLSQLAQQIAPLGLGIAYPRPFDRVASAVLADLQHPDPKVGSDPSRLVQYALRGVVALADTSTAPTPASQR